jgi:hypothetical protein
LETGSERVKLALRRKFLAGADHETKNFQEWWSVICYVKWIQKGRLNCWNYIHAYSTTLQMFLINSMEQSPSEADTCSAGQEIPCLDGSQRFNAMFKGN